MASSTQKHPYHIVDPSPWPIVASISAVLMAVGAILMMHDKNSVIIWFGAAGLVLTSIMWWRDVLKEGIEQKCHSDEVRHGFRYGMALFIVSEVMFFVAFFWAYFNSSIIQIDLIDGIWPPKHITTLDPFEIPFLNTLILLLSGCTVTWAHHGIRENNRSVMVKGLGLTVLLGVLFLSFQAYEYIHASFTFDQGIYPSTFYMATGFHGMHVLIGTIFLFVCFLRARKGHFTPKAHFGFEAAAWYWHFVDVVWLFLFISIYWYGQ
jgi:cytochrome c oxidase subunit III